MSYVKDIFDLIEEKPIFTSALIALLIIQIDLMTGEDIEFSILFVIPVALAAWSLKPFQAYVLSIALPLLRLGFVLFYWEKNHVLDVLLYNAVINVAALTGYAYLITKVSRQKRNLKEKITKLEKRTGNSDEA